jgi:hypothetical protein
MWPALAETELVEQAACRLPNVTEAEWQQDGNCSPNGSNMGFAKSVLRKIQHVRRLSGRERALLGTSLVLLPVTAICLRLAGFQQWQFWLHSWGARKKGGAVDDPEMAAREAAHIVAVAARYSLIGRTCLPQAMVLSFLLQRMGLKGDLRIGVRQEGKELKAHAWIEQQGHILNDSADVHERFAAFAGPISPALGGTG